jgi:hypothetical protein
MKPLGIYEFQMLSENEQASHLWECGEYLVTRIEAENKINLYALKDYYVEVTYQGQINKITGLRIFKTLRLLEPYLDQLDLNELLGEK